MDPISYDYREVACPACGANAGSYCKRPSGHSGPIVQPRRAAAHLMWQQEELTKYGRIITTWDEAPAAAPATPAPTSGQLSLF
ncbi:zinc finger domain-containing protein [Hymenobacter mucosus]